MDRLFEDHYEHSVITREQFEEYNRRYLAEQEELIRRREELGGAGEDEEPIDLSIIRDSAASIRESWDALSVSKSACSSPTSCGGSYGTRIGSKSSGSTARRRLSPTAKFAAGSPMCDFAAFDQDTHVCWA